MKYELQFKMEGHWNTIGFFDGVNEMAKELLFYKGFSTIEDVRVIIRSPSSERLK